MTERTTVTAVRSDLENSGLDVSDYTDAAIQDNIDVASRFITKRLEPHYPETQAAEDDLQLIEQKVAAHLSTADIRGDADGERVARVSSDDESVRYFQDSGTSITDHSSKFWKEALLIDETGRLSVKVKDPFIVG